MKLNRVNILKTTKKWLKTEVTTFFNRGKIRGIFTRFYLMKLHRELNNLGLLQFLNFFIAMKGSYSKKSIEEDKGFILKNT